MSDPQKALPILRELHSLGITLAVDDFGTGYSSLAYLRQLPVDEVKIDKSFVLGMGTDLGDLAVVRSIVELGHSLGLTVVAEGVEEDVARDQLEAMGCDVAQGYLISRPLPEERLEAWLQARTARSPDATRRDRAYPADLRFCRSATPVARLGDGALVIFPSPRERPGPFSSVGRASPW